MITKPKVAEREAQPYMGIRTQVPMKAFKQVIPQLLDEVFAWLEQQGIEPTGAPFMRLHVIDMAAEMDIALGVPVATASPGNERIEPGVLPAGRYASLIYTGSGLKGNRALLDWAAENGLVWDRWDDANGDAFAARIESFLTDPAEERNQAKWQTEVAIRLADQ